MQFSARSVALGGLMAAMLPSAAVAVPTCGLQTVSGGVASATYDPFHAGQTNITVTNLVLSRVNGPGGEKTMRLAFYVRPQSTAADDMNLVINSVVGAGTGYGYGNDILHNYNGPFPVPDASINAAVPGTFLWVFGGNDSKSDTFTANVTLTLPAYLNLSASDVLPLDIVYSCEGTGKGGNFTDADTYPNAIQAGVTVLSALQASYAGQPLNFGDISEVPAIPLTPVRTADNNFIRVQSSGPYTVELTSGNSYLLKHPDGDPTVNERVKYELEFLDETRDNMNSTAISATCGAAGITPAFEDHLYLRGTLQEGGVGKTPANASYEDMLTVTITPEAAGFPTSVSDCDSFGTID